MKFPMTHIAPTAIELPDDRLLAPELLYPGRKPVGEVEINWDHPLARGLWEYLHMDGNLEPVTLVRKVASVNTGDFPLAGSRAYGLCPYMLNGDRILSVPLAREDAPFTLVLDFESTVNMTWETGIFSWGTGIRDSGAWISLRSHPTSDNTMRWHLAGNFRINVPSPLDTPTRYFLTYDGTTSIAYVDGEYDGEYATSLDTTRQGNNLVVGSAYNGSSRGYYGNLALYDRALSAEEVMEYHKAPYQFLKPKAKPKRLKNVIDEPEDIIIPDSRFEMPELLYPGRKPTGDVVGAQLLHKASMYLLGPTVAARDVYGFSDPMVNINSWSESKGGYVEISDNTYMRVGAKILGDNSFTSVAVVRMAALPDATQFVYGDLNAFANDGWGVGCRDADDVWRGYLRMSSGTKVIDIPWSDISWDAGWVTIVLQYDKEASMMRFTVDEYYAELDISTSGTLITNAGRNTNINAYGSNDYAGNGVDIAFYGIIFGAAGIDVKDLARNPYKFLCPA